MRTSKTGHTLIKSFEGCHKRLPDGRIEAYLCPAGVWTIGWGTTKGIRPGMIITSAQADALFLEDLKKYEDAVNRLVKVDLTQNQFDALVSFVYNLGETAFAKSTLLKRLNAGQYAGVPEQFVRWNKARVKGKLVPLRGLTRRRAAEAALFSANDTAGGDGDIQPSLVEAQRPKPKVKSRKFWGTLTAGFSAVASWTTSQVDGLSQGINAATDQILPVLPYVPSLSTILVILTVAGVVLAIYAQFDDDHKEQP